MSARQELADLLYDHQMRGEACACGWKPDTLDHVDHQAEVLIAAGWQRTGRRTA